MTSSDSLVFAGVRGQGAAWPSSMYNVAALQKDTHAPESSVRLVSCRSLGQEILDFREQA